MSDNEVSGDTEVGGKTVENTEDLAENNTSSSVKFEEPVDNKADESNDNDDSIDVDSDGDSDNSSASSSDNESDSSEDEDEPPRLKYTRFTKLPSALLNKDAISTCLSNKSIVIFGTHSGVIHLMNADFSPIRTFRAHKASILSIHSDGDHFATGSMDGTVVVGSLSDPNDIIAYDFKRPIHAVALEGQYSLTKSFFTGGTSGKIISSSKNWLGQRIDTVIGDCEGIVLSLQLFGDLLVAIGENGINFYQVPSRSKIYQLKPPSGFPRPDLYWPKCDVFGNTLLIGWANNIWSIKLLGINTSSESRSMYSSRSFSSEKRIHIDKHVQLKDNLIAGISSIGQDYLILNYNHDKTAPELKVLSGITLEELCVDEIELKNYAALGLNDYHLVRYKDHSWFLVGANDVIIVDELNSSDTLKWYLDRNQYLPAWELSRGLMDEKSRYESIGLNHLQNLIEHKSWEEAKSFLNQITEEIEDSSMIQKIWETWLVRYFELDQFDVIVEAIPNNIQFQSGIYDTVLQHYLELKSGKFVELMKLWPHDRFDREGINVRIGEILKDYDQGDKEGITGGLVRELRNVHIELCVELGQFSHAAEHYFTLKDPGVLAFLSSHHLLEEFFQKIPTATTIDLSKDELKYNSIDLTQSQIGDRVAILVENRHEILPDALIKLMHENDLDIVSFLYLKQLFDLPGFITTQYEDIMVELTSKFNPTQLLQFLQRFKNYDIEKAIEICQKNGLKREQVFLFSKVGENKRALDIIINDLKDPQYAISFTLSLKDSDLFEHLIEYSTDKPDFIKLLIIEAGNNQIDPKKIITRIPSNIEIENLRKTLVNITGNNLSELLIHTKVLNIIQDEAMLLIYELRDQRLQGEVFDPIEMPKISQGETIISFNDEKMYTESELLGQDNVWKHVARTISEKIKHYIYIRNRKDV